MQRRLNAFQQSGVVDAVLNDSALAEASALLQAAQPTDPEHPTPEDNWRLPAAYHAVGWLHFLRFIALPDNDLSELARAIVVLAPLAEHVEAIPEPLRGVLGASAEVDQQATLANHLLEHAQATTDQAPIYAGIVLLAAALTVAPPDDPNRAHYLSDLSIGYHLRFERSGVAADLDQAIELGEQALLATPDDHSDRARRLSNLGNTYRARFERGGVAADVDRAVELGEQALVATPDDHPNRAMYLSNLGNAYRARFRHGGVEADLDRAVEVGEQALLTTPDDHPNRAMYLSNLGLAYEVRFRRDGVEADLDRAVEVGEQALLTTPDDHPNRAMYLTNLGLAYEARFERGGVAADLDRAIEVGEQALLTTPDDHPGQAAMLSNLGNAYLARFERRGVAADLDRAVEVGEQALLTTPDDHPDRAMYLSNLGNAYRVRFERRGVAADLDRAVEVGEQALVATPDDDYKRARYLSPLGGAYLLLAKRDGAAPLDRAVDLGEQALVAIPDDDPHRGPYLSGLSSTYRVRFEHDGVAADLDRAIDLGEQALVATPDDHPDQALHLSNLSGMYRIASDAGGRVVDQTTLHRLARQVAAVVTASPADQVRAKGGIGSLAHAAGEHSLAVELLDAAVALVPSAVPRESEWADQERRLGAYRGLVEEAIAAHCAIKDPAGAVEVAELGRGVMLAAQLDSRTELTDLDRTHPDLAARLRQVRELLNTPHNTGIATPGEPSIEISRSIADRKRWWSEHDELLAEIRQQPGSVRFLLPPRLPDLQPALTGGTVVVVNAGRCRCDAIIITDHNAPILVQLPDLTRSDVDSHARELLTASYGGSVVGILRRQRVVPVVLGWLWDAIVEPILRDGPPLRAAERDTLPRVWWLPTGPLALFPLHAAGHLGQPGALDAMVSSYTPTLRTLVHACTRPPAASRHQLTVALHHTRGLPDLPGTVAEAKALHNRHPDLPFLLDDTATTDRVLAALPVASWVHFACHADVDFTAPSRGGLRLHDATLSLTEVGRLRLTHAELAYLSACSTAHPGIQHADESLHPASAFQLAGFRHVIGSLWPISDPLAAAAATTFYEHLPPEPSASHAAVALHRTICGLRAQHLDRPDLWAALIHSGP
ncbi:CHAT domain-containing protein [Nocardia terpenica]|uniref:CHAT domain-containing protein n=2 Tax=Nocardia terpenica TaxID=455432 RepID=A0A6G9ZFZ1_9NOCA|nr:CHAT domain-containing protein [Nocardia terpenica]